MNLKGPAAARTLTTVDDLVLSVIRYETAVEERLCSLGSELLLVQEDSLTLGTELDTVTLERGEMTVVPRGIPYRVEASGSAVALLATKAESEGNQD